MKTAYCCISDFLLLSAVMHSVHSFIQVAAHERLAIPSTDADTCLQLPARSYSKPFNISSIARPRVQFWRYEVNGRSLSSTPKCSILNSWSLLQFSSPLEQGKNVCTSYSACTVTQAVTLGPVSAEASFRFYFFCVLGGQTGSGVFFSLSTSVFCCQHHYVYIPY